MSCEYCGIQESVNIILTCGFTVCLDHLNDRDNNFQCMICKNHLINKEVLFKMNKNRSTLSKLEYTNYFKSIEEKCSNLKTIKQSPEFHINIFLMQLRERIENQRQLVTSSILKMIDLYADSLLEEMEKFRPKYFKIITENLNLINLDQIESEVKQLTQNKSNNEPNFYSKQIKNLKNLAFKLEYMDSLFQNSVKFESKEDKIQIDIDKCFGRLKIGLYSKPVAPDLTKLQEISHLEANATCLALLKSGEIVSGTKGGMIKIWNSESGSCVKKIKAHKSIVNCIKLNDKEILYTCSNDNTIKIWEKETYKCVKTIRSPNCSIQVIELWKDKIISSDWSEVIRIWDAQSGECVQILNDHQSFVYCMILLESNRLLSGSNDKNIILWDLENFCSLKLFSGHRSSVMCLHMFDQTNFISGSKDGEIKIWNIDTNQCLVTIKGHEKAVRELQICENKELLSCSEDGMIKLWTEISEKSISEIKIDSTELVCLRYLQNGELITCEKSGIIRIFSE